MKKKWIWFIVCSDLLMVLLFLPFFIPLPSNIVFRQFELEARDSKRLPLSLYEQAFSALSGYSARVASLISGSASPDGLDARSVSEAIFKHIPILADVIPTERYYYFRFTANGTEYTGNFRLMEIEDGVITMGVAPKKLVERNAYGAIRLDKVNGLTTLHLGGRYWLVSYAGRAVIFRLPKEIITTPPDFTLKDNEKYVGWVRDDSGLCFHLIFQKDRPSMYYVLDKNYAALEDFERLPNGLELGSMSKFVFWTPQSEPDRRYLIAVNKDQVDQNTYFDGPFDQVPARHDIRKLVYSAYPYLKLGGVDPFGYFCMIGGMRIAISPYLDYGNIEEVNALKDRCDKTAQDAMQLSQCMTFDKKQYNHLESKAFLENGELVKGVPKTCDRAPILDTSTRGEPLRPQ